MSMQESWVGAPVRKAHEAEIDRHTVIAFWRLGRALEAGAPRDREVFTLGRCIGGTTGITSMLYAYAETDDPASFAMSRLMFGGDQPMLDAYWQSLDDPVVFQLARCVYRTAPEFREDATAQSDEGGWLIFDVSGPHARLAGIRFAALR
jgi:hypothetical protein